MQSDDYPMEAMAIRLRTALQRRGRIWTNLKPNVKALNILEKQITLDYSRNILQELISLKNNNNVSSSLEIIWNYFLYLFLSEIELKGYTPAST